MLPLGIGHRNRVNVYQAKHARACFQHPEAGEPLPPRNFLAKRKYRAEPPWPASTPHPNAKPPNWSRLCIASRRAQ